MPSVDKAIQKSLWGIADALAKALRAPSGDQPGDVQWRVSALASRAWKVSHPDLPLVKDEDGANKDTLLQLHIQPDPDTKQWFVIAQNKVTGPEGHTSPRALIVAKYNEPPSENWDNEEIANAAANFFKQQLKDLVQKAKAMTPEENPGTPPPVTSGLKRKADRIVFIKDSDLNRVKDLIKDMKDDDWKREAEFLEKLVVDSEAVLAESSGKIRKKSGVALASRTARLAKEIVRD